jgi:hypothetical protein
MIGGFFANQTEGVRHETEFRAGRANSEPIRGRGDSRDHPMVASLNELFGDHTFFLNSDGLNVVEPNETGARAGRVVNIANWTYAHLTSLAPHEPEPTEIIVMLATEH